MQKRNRSTTRIVGHKRAVILPEGLGLVPKDIIDFDLLDDGTIIIQKLSKQTNTICKEQNPECVTQ